MKICFVSDLHVDVGSQSPIRWVEADVLVIAGDTANTIGDLVKFLQKLQKKRLFKHVLFIEGNHENYASAARNRTIDETLQRIDELKPEGTTFLSRERAVKIGDYYFVGRCGWYSLDAMGDPIANRARWKTSINDDKWIGFSQMGIYPWDLAVQHAQEIDEIITETIAHDPAARFIVVTHMAPCRQTLSRDLKDLFSNPFYANLHLEAVMERHADHITAWAHGHVHNAALINLHGVDIVVNPRGYGARFMNPAENPGWKPLVIEFD